MQTRLLSRARPSWSARAPLPFNSRCSSTRVYAQNVKTTRAAPGLAPLPWTGAPEQQQALQQLQQRMSASTHGCTDVEVLKWYLRDRYFDVDEAEAKLTAAIKWRQRFMAGNLTLDDVRAEYNTGKSFVHNSLDRYNRPVLIIKARCHNSGEFPLEDSKRLCAYSLDTALSKMPPGVEQILGVIDLKGMQLSNIDLPFVAFMVDAFFVYYPRRMGQVLLVDAPWFFKGPWEAIKPLLRKYAALVRFVSRQELANEFFTSQTLPKDFAS